MARVFWGDGLLTENNVPTSMYNMSKRGALLEAGKDLLWERGYAAMSPRDVLRRSGAGQGSLYHFFDGKEALAKEALSEVATEVRERIAATCGPGSGTGMQRIERFLKADRDAMRGCRLGRMAQDPELPESLRLCIASGLDGLEAVLQRAVRDAQLEGGLPRDLDPVALAEVIIAVVQGGYVLSRAHNSSERMARVTNALLASLKKLEPLSLPAFESRKQATPRRKEETVKTKHRRDRNGKQKPRF